MDRLMKATSNYFIKIKSWEEDLKITEAFKVQIPDLLEGQYLGFYDDCESFEISQITKVNEDGTIEIDQTAISPKIFNGFVFLCAPPKSFIDLNDKIKAYEIENPQSGTASISVPNLSMTKTTEAQQGAFAVFSKEIQSFRKWGRPLKEILWEVQNA